MLAAHGWIIPHRLAGGATGQVRTLQRVRRADVAVSSGPRTSPGASGRLSAAAHAARRARPRAAPRRPRRRPASRRRAAAGRTPSPRSRRRRTPRPRPPARRSRRPGRRRRAGAVCGRVRSTSARRGAPTTDCDAGDAHERGGVDEAGGDAADDVRCARRWSSAPRGRPGRARASSVAAIHGPASSGVRSGVMTPTPAGRRPGRSANALDAVALDRVPVGHDQGRRAGARPRPRRWRSTSRVRGALAQRDARTASWIVGPSMSGSE